MEHSRQYLILDLFYKTWSNGRTDNEDLMELDTLFTKNVEDADSKSLLNKNEKEELLNRIRRQPLLAS